MEDGSKRKRELEAQVLDKVGEVISDINKAKHVDQVISALHSLAILLFPIDASLFIGSIDERYRSQLLSAQIPCAEERDEWWRVFYHGASFPTMARFLLQDLASNWLACFSISARKHIYDAFFVHGLATEVVQNLVPCLQQKANDGVAVKSVQSNTERLLILCLLENDGVLQMAREFGGSYKSQDSINKHFEPTISRVAQIVASIPDKAQSRGRMSLSSHLFFKQITIQLLSLAEERNMNPIEAGAILKGRDGDDTLLFVGEIFSRIYRRGSVDVLLSEIVSRVLRHVRSLLASTVDSSVSDVFDLDHASQFWLGMMQTIKDSYVLERVSEQLLHQLARQHVNDVEAFWTLWLLFHRIFEYQPSARSMFVDKFLFWKVFPLCCLRWILHFAVLESPPDENQLGKKHATCNFLMTLQRLVAVWSKREFVQSATMEQQSYVSAAIGISLETMSREDLDETKDVMPLILQGVSCRLESPNHLVRKMASCVALGFSKVIDPKNPLYLDDSCTGDTIDWSFGVTTSEEGALGTSEKGIEVEQSSISLLEKDLSHTSLGDVRSKVKSKSREISEYKLIDPDEIIDPITLNCESVSDNDESDNESENSDTSSDSSLQPYDLTDDDTDLKRNFSQLVDVVGALRKSDDADGVEKALDVAEKLVRASPDELRHVASDLVRTLVQVRCSDLSVEGEEESAEGKRQRALVALIVTCPLESLDTLNKLLYSPNVDISQRMMILDVMTDAAQELADSKTMKPKSQLRPIIETMSESQPWFLPSDKGPVGAGIWKEFSEAGTLLNWANCYERELPLKPGQVRRGKTRRWSQRSANLQGQQIEWSHNKFPMYASAFMLPAMQGFDKRRQGVDLLGRDFIVMGKLIHMLGVCMKCAANHPEAFTLAPPLLDMLRCRDLCHHKEAYVRRAVLFTASCVLVSLHPSYVASSLIEGNSEISQGLEWIRTWAIHIAESDTDRECYTMGMACLQLHAEMALQASRAMESAESKIKGVGISSPLSKGTIKIPYIDGNH